MKEESKMEEIEEEIDLELDGKKKNEDRVTCSDQSTLSPSSDENSSERIIFQPKHSIPSREQESIGAKEKNKNLISNPFNAPTFLPGESKGEEAPKPDLLVMMRGGGAPKRSNSSHPSGAISTASSSFHPLIQALKEWSYSSFLVNKQRLAERILLPLQSGGNSASSPRDDPHVILRSRDPVLESRIECLKKSREKHEEMERIVERSILPALESLSSAFSSLALLMNDLSVPSTTDYSLIPNGATSQEPESEEEEDLARVASVNLSSCDNSLSAHYKQLSNQLGVHGVETDKLRAGLDFFCSSLRTLIDQSMKDCFETIRDLESARITFDAERNHHHAQLIRIASSSQAGEREGEDGERELLDRLNLLEARFEGLKKDVEVKLNFLFFNQEKVMRKESALLSSLFSAYFAPSLTGQPLSGSSSSSLDSNLDLVLRAYSIKMVAPRERNDSRLGRLAAARRSLSIPSNLSRK